MTLLDADSSTKPYAATIHINDVLYGTGYGSSKKTAKVEAARKTIDILLPEFGKKIDEDAYKETDLSVSCEYEYSTTTQGVPSWKTEKSLRTFKLNNRIYLLNKLSNRVHQ